MDNSFIIYYPYNVQTCVKELSAPHDLYKRSGHNSGHNMTITHIHVCNMNSVRLKNEIFTAFLVLSV